MSIRSATAGISTLTNFRKAFRLAFQRRETRRASTETDACVAKRRAGRIMLEMIANPSEWGEEEVKFFLRM